MSRQAVPNSHLSPLAALFDTAFGKLTSIYAPTLQKFACGARLGTFPNSLRFLQEAHEENSPSETVGSKAALGLLKTSRLIRFFDA